MSITIIIIIVTCLVSLAGFSSEKIKSDLIFYPPAITYDKQWYRFITCGFVHADFGHLLFNMYSFYLFGQAVEKYFTYIFQEKGKVLYLALYISALFFCLLPTYARHKNDSSYASLGASGAVSAVIFAFILLDPLVPIGIIFIPGINIPGFLFGALYLIISSYLDRRGRGGINHSAHIWGALYGIVFLTLTSYAFSNYHALEEFVKKIQFYLGRL